MKDVRELVARCQKYGYQTTEIRIERLSALLSHIDAQAALLGEVFAMIEERDIEHHQDCEWWFVESGGTCTCGLDQTLAALQSRHRELTSNAVKGGDVE